MRPRSSLGFTLLLAALVGTGGLALWSQSLQTMSLRTELEAARTEVGQSERLRAENVRLRSQQISSAQLEALRADHAALPQLRAQVEAFNRPSSP